MIPLGLTSAWPCCSPCQLGTAAYSVSYARWGVELLFLANAKQLNAELFKVDDMLSSLAYVPPPSSRPVSFRCQRSMVWVWRARCVVLTMLTRVLRSYSYSHQATGIIVLIGMGVLFRVLTFVLMMRGKTQARRR